MKRRILFTVLALIMGLCVPSMEGSAAKKQKKWEFDDLKDKYVIAANVKVDGYGVGYHSKLVFVAQPECAVSFGIQYDDDAWPPYKSRLALLFEDIYSNKHEPGEQVYYRPSDVKLKINKYYHLMMAMDKKGKADVYFNHKKIATYRNKKMAGKDIFPRVEGCAKYNGDIVKTEFKNIQVKIKDYDDLDFLDTTHFDTAPNIKSTVLNPSHVLVQGYLSGLNPGEHWDSAYESVSGIVQYDISDIFLEDDD